MQKDVTLIDDVLAAANRIILGKQEKIRLAICCLLADGHLLIEDLPGVGKTTLAHTLAQLLGLQFARIQFTSDMLPADVVGLSIYDREQHNFKFLPGAIFTQVLLADEINRATPKTQSALLEGMEERQVTYDGQTRALPSPFFVIATQNPTSQIGTFPLPESQLDRFLMKIELGYPDRVAERELLENAGKRPRNTTIAPVLTPATIASLQQEARHVNVAPALLDYVQNLLESTRKSAMFAHGLSPRSGLGLMTAAKVWAFMSGRNLVLPEDVQAVFPSIAAHRLRAVNSTQHATQEDIEALIRSTPLG